MYVKFKSERVKSNREGQEIKARIQAGLKKVDAVGSITVSRDRVKGLLLVERGVYRQLGKNWQGMVEMEGFKGEERERLE